MANYRRLVAELQEDRDRPLTAADIARAFGISNVYAWQLENGKRDSINSKAARLIERKCDKPEGWMDTNFELWPFPDTDLLARVEELRPDQRIEVQGAMRRAVIAFERAPAAPDVVDDEAKRLADARKAAEPKRTKAPKG